MKTTRVLATVALAIGVGTTAQAQGTIPGAQDGAARGGAAAGPLGAIVGGAVGAATGTVGGILGVDTRPRFRTYAHEHRHPSYSFGGPVAVGTVLPTDGVSYYDVPADYGVHGYRYTVVNGQTVLVEPGTRRIVEVID